MCVESYFFFFFDKTLKKVLFSDKRLDLPKTEKSQSDSFYISEQKKQ